MSVYGFDTRNIFFLLSKDAVNPVNSGTTTANRTINNPYTYDPTNTTFPYGNPNIPTNGTASGV